MTDKNSNAISRRTALAGLGAAAGVPIVGTAADAGDDTGDPFEEHVSWGTSTAVGNGEITPFVTGTGSPTAVGLYLESAALTGLPDAEEHHHIALPEDTVFEWLGFDWLPAGHGPEGVYDVAHFDVHYYLTSEAAVRDIPEINYPPGTGDPYDVPIAPDQRPPNYFRTRSVVPEMGEHLFDADAPEWAEPGRPSGEPFTHTFIWGHWDGDLIFYEPMATCDFLADLDGAVAEPIGTPDRMPEAGTYPTAYRIAFHERRDAYTVTLDGFEPFERSDGRK